MKNYINNNECYFKLDSTVDGDLLAANLKTFDTQAQGISSTETFSIQGNATFKDQVSATGLTSGATYNLNAQNFTSSQISIDFKNNRLSNCALPKEDCDPVPANYIRSPEYFFCSKPLSGDLDFNPGESYLPLTGSEYTLYQSRNVNSIFRFIGWKQSTRELTVGGNTAIQFLAAGTYIVSFTVGKRWGWNNGWGGAIYINNGLGQVQCESTIYSGGGYATIGTLGTSIYRASVDVAPNPNDPNASDRYRAGIFYLSNGGSSAGIGSYSFSLLYYPDDRG
ncbi:conserved hypothetical protein [Chlamydia pneumoniae LPCoLN]|uniref:hypothetical protein n=1 Tax=Chlamydia pneumoniae TaxID=83558 RepID=UPI0001BD9CBF|nr:hypothetical protein [Chlamydia pneumoniae]ACZ33232.1 conserved hypothetical protein [Chlamydia pneumoniae LPCoLN]ETR80137.1 hypothetical protein X556_0541 [Chlamydia pneumoniae B21]